MTDFTHSIPAVLSDFDLEGDVHRVTTARATLLEAMAFVVGEAIDGGNPVAQKLVRSIVEAADGLQALAWELGAKLEGIARLQASVDAEAPDDGLYGELHDMTQALEAISYWANQGALKGGAR